MKTNPPIYWDRHDWPSLLEAARQGVDGAVGEVFERLNLYCLMITGSRMSVELAPKLGASDIVQKSMMEAFARFSSFTGCTEKEICSWLVTIVNHNVIDAARHFRNAQRRSYVRECRLDGRSDTGAPSLRYQPPSFAMRRQEEDFALQKAIAQLPERQRRAVVLRYRDGLSHRQIAAALQISEVAARKLCSRAIDQLRTALAVEHGPPNRTPR